MKENTVLAMYDIRGIQSYIFRTTKVKDAMGASGMIENIMMEALEDAIEKEHLLEESDLLWFDGDKAIPYNPQAKKVKVLFIGGGNAYVMFESKELCISVNCHMSKYILDKTYSLQLAVAIVPVSGHYSFDFSQLHNQMDQNKADHVTNRPYGALPIMKIEKNTGYPVTHLINGEECSTETYLKQQRKNELNETGDSKVVENLIQEKGTDSLLAVVHIDGNNIGNRIQSILQNEDDYTIAINKMRQLSCAIKFSFLKVFNQMRHTFDKKCIAHPLYKTKKTDCFVRKILVAGDDITYVCTGKIALATVEYFCKHIAQYTLTGNREEGSSLDFGFSVCAGVSFVGSHFPFSVAYEVAEACCSQAKARAKAPENRVGERIANFVDYQFCKMVQTKDLERIRQKEYITCYGERLIKRPYYIGADAYNGVFDKLEESSYSFHKLKEYVRYFQNPNNIPRSHAKTLMNTYSLGHHQVEQQQAFLASRNFVMPDHSNQMYQNLEAKWFDALELMDCFLTLEEIENLEDKENENL